MGTTVTVSSLTYLYACFFAPLMLQDMPDTYVVTVSLFHAI